MNCRAFLLTAPALVACATDPRPVTLPYLAPAISALAISALATLASFDDAMAHRGVSPVLNVVSQRLQEA